MLSSVVDGEAQPGIIKLGGSLRVRVSAGLRYVKPESVCSLKLALHAAWRKEDVLAWSSSLLDSSLTHPMQSSQWQPVAAHCITLSLILKEYRNIHSSGSPFANKNNKHVVKHPNSKSTNIPFIWPWGSTYQLRRTVGVPFGCRSVRAYFLKKDLWIPSLTMKTFLNLGCLVSLVDERDTPNQ